MHRATLLLLPLLFITACQSSRIQNSAPSEAAPTPTTSDYRNSPEYLVILQAATLEASVVGAGAERPRAVLALRHLIAWPNAAEVLADLCESSNPATRLYAAIGLFYVDRALYDQVAATYPPDQRLLTFPGGCIGSVERVESVLRSFESGELWRDVIESSATFYPVDREFSFDQHCRLHRSAAAVVPALFASSRYQEYLNSLIERLSPSAPLEFMQGCCAFMELESSELGLQCIDTISELSPWSAAHAELLIDWHQEFRDSEKHAEVRSALEKLFLDGDFWRWAPADLCEALATGERSIEPALRWEGQERRRDYYEELPETADTWHDHFTWATLGGVFFRLRPLPEVIDLLPRLRPKVREHLIDQTDFWAGRPEHELRALISGRVSYDGLTSDEVYFLRHEAVDALCERHDVDVDAWVRELRELPDELVESALNPYSTPWLRASHDQLREVYGPESRYAPEPYSRTDLDEALLEVLACRRDGVDYPVEPLIAAISESLEIIDPVVEAAVDEEELYASQLLQHLHAHSPRDLAEQIGNAVVALHRTLHSDNDRKLEAASNATLILSEIVDTAGGHGGLNFIGRLGSASWPDFDD